MAVTRSTAIHIYCKDCIGDDRPRDCGLTHCPLYRYRTGGEDKKVSTLNRVPRSGAIRRFCRECVCGSDAKAVRSRCLSPGCTLYPYRF